MGRSKVEERRLTMTPILAMCSFCWCVLECEVMLRLCRKQKEKEKKGWKKRRDGRQMYIPSAPFPLVRELTLS